MAVVTAHRAAHMARQSITNGACEIVMASKVTVHGPAGEVRWGYYPAAAVGAWTITAGSNGSVLTATVTRSDPYRLRQPALRFQITRQDGRSWSWPIIELSIADGTLTAALGPQE